MSYIKFTYDVDENVWFFDASNKQVGQNELHFCFASTTEKVRFKNLNFSYSIKHNDEVVENGTYPPTGVEYQYTDSGPLAIARFSFEPDQRYYITVTAANSGKYREDTFELVGIRPPKPPFESWSWNGETWAAPLPLPTDGIYEWHESKLVWHKLTDLPVDDDPERQRPNVNNS
jgi:hypothetical protein